jgi:hypothetical protein
VAVTVLAVLGLARRFFGPERTAMLAYFLVFAGIDLLFYAGSYDYGADVRYSLMTYPPLAVLGGLGAARVVDWVDRTGRRWLAPGVLTAGLLCQFLWYAPVVRAMPEEAWAARADVTFAETLVPELRGSSYVLTHNPGMFHVWGVNAGQMSLAAENPAFLRDLESRYPGRVYLHWNFWCNTQDPRQRDFCRRVLELGPAETVREHQERDQRYVLYRLKGT